MRRKVLQILLRRFRKWKMATSLMEWMMILVRSSSGSSSIKHTVVAIKKNGGNNTATGLATRVEVGSDEG
jgi:hypothetical protein